MKTKICIKCKVEKPLSEFYKRKDGDGYRNECKKCKKDISNQYRKDNPDYNINYQQQYRKDNPEKVKEKNKKNYIKHREKRLKSVKQYNKNHKKDKKYYNKQYRIDHLEELKEYDKQYRENNKEKRKNNNKKWREENPDYDKNKQKEKYNNDILFKLSCNMRTMLNQTLKLIGTKKEGRTNDNLGYSPLQLKQRLEMNFTDGMSWENHGEWEKDHTIPKDYFIKKGITDPKIINALCNLKPRWKINRIINNIFYLGNSNKSNKIIK